MILAFDLHSRGSNHIPFNSAMLQTVSHAAPGQVTRLYAEANHVAELKCDPLLASNPRLSFHSISLSPYFPSKKQLVSARRAWREYLNISAALRGLPRDEPCLILLLNTTPTALFISTFLAGLRKGASAVLACLHGELELLRGWRSRNPLYRAFDLRAALTMTRDVPLRYLVLEEAIRRQLAQEIPEWCERIAVFPHPANPVEIPLATQQPLTYPVRVGLIGKATEGKGTASFLHAARHFKAKYGARVEFYLLGNVLPGNSIEPFSVLDGPVSHVPLPRPVFRDLLRQLHFAFLPLQSQYYSWAASGALLDAITWLKPVIATPVPIVSDIFDRFGDIGYLCESDDQMQATLDCVLAEMDGHRYARQLDALLQVREERRPLNLASNLRTALEDLLPGMLLQ